MVARAESERRDEDALMADVADVEEAEGRGVKAREGKGAKGQGYKGHELNYKYNHHAP